MCAKFGMTEEQFWASNPRILKVWSDIYKQKVEDENRKMHLYTGAYTLSALITAIDKCLNGKKAKSEYISEPLRLFEPTAEEKKKAQEAELQRFIAWGNEVKSRFGNKT